MFVSEVLFVHGHWKLINKLVLRLIAQEVVMQVKEKVKSKIMQNKVNSVSKGKAVLERSQLRKGAVALCNWDLWHHTHPVSWGKIN